MSPRPSWQSRYRTSGLRRERFRSGKLFTPTPTERPGFRLSVPKPVWLGLGLAGLVGVAGWFFFLSPTFAIERIDVVGDVTPEVQAEVNSLYGKNLLTYSSGGMADRLRSAQSSIRDLQVFKGLPDTIRLEIALRDPVLAWRSQDQLYLIDAAGVAFQVANPEERITERGLVTVVDTANQPVIIGEQHIRRELVAFIRQLGSDFSRKFPLTVDRIEVGQSTFELTLVTSAGWRVVVDSTRTLDPQLDALISIFASFHDNIKEYVDLRIEGRAYFK